MYKFIKSNSARVNSKWKDKHIMNDENYQLADKYVSHGYVQQGREARRVLEKNIRVLLEQGKVPSVGWNELSIKHLLQEISLMDSNNFPDNCGVGEREARIACPLVAQRHFHLGHGIGRSGDIAEIQPKAAGSSLLAKLANSFALDVIKMQGVKSANSCLLVPVATGMALVLTMITLKERRPNAKYVIWPRIDQKSCFKSILTAGLEPIIVENKMVGDYLETDLDTIRHVIQNVGSENVLCVLTTTSCFAPRIPDKLEEVGQICKDSDVPHVINNAYGVQSSKCMHLIQQACRVGRVDAFIQSTDKNFMVPVGGAIIAGFDKTFIQAVGKMYPGRASASPIVDFFITMLSLGETGYAELLKERKELYEHLKTGLNAVTGKFGERAMEIKQNQISIAVTLGNIDALSSGEKKNVTEFGSYLFKRSVSGTRVVTPHDTKTIGRYTFTGWGAHHNSYPTSYLTAAAAVGTTKQDIDQFLKRLEKTFKLFIKEPVPTVLASSSLKSSPSAPSSISAAFADSNQLQQETPSSFGLLQQTENLRLPQPGGDLRPTKSMNDKTRNNNNESLSSSVLLSAAERQSQLTRPGSFSSYQNLLSHRQSTGSGGGAELPHPRDTYSLCSGTRSLGQYGRYGSDSSLVSRDYTTSSSRDSCGSSRDGLVGGRLKTDDIVQQLVIPGEIPPDKMSFLIDI